MIPDLRSLMLLAVLALVVLAIRRIPASQLCRTQAAGVAGSDFLLPRGFSRHLSPSGNGAACVPQPLSTTKVPTCCRPNCWQRATGRDHHRQNFLCLRNQPVLVTPVLAPKMPPGHALMLAPGVLLHLPGLTGVVLVGLTAALLAILVRRFAGAGAAAIAVALWLTQAAQGRWRGSDLSQNTTTVCWLVGWWSLLRWRETGRGRWLLLLAGVTGWGATSLRLLVMIAFTLPVAAIVIRDTIRSGRWAQLGRALALGVAILAFDSPCRGPPSRGSGDSTALGLYTRQYLPFDKMGFGFDPTPPLVEAPAFYAAANTGFEARHREHTPRALPGIFAARLKVWAATNFSFWRRFLVPLALLGLLLLPARCPGLESPPPRSSICSTSATRRRTILVCLLCRGDACGGRSDCARGAVADRLCARPRPARGGRAAASWRRSSSSGPRPTSHAGAP